MTGTRTVRTADVEGVIRHILEPVSGVVEIVATKRSVPDSHALELHVSPHSKTAAPVWVMAVDGGEDISLSIGEHTVLEIWGTETRNVLAELAEICEAIVAGRFSETLWVMNDGYVARSKSRIGLSSETLRPAHWSSRGRFARKTKRVVSYTPYSTNRSGIRSASAPPYE